MAQGGAAVSRAGCPRPVLASRCELAPAGRAPPPRAQRGFIKSGCEEAQEASWLQPAGSEPWACRSQRAAHGFCAQVFICSTAQLFCSPGVLQWPRPGLKPLSRKPKIQEQSRGVTTQENLFLIYFSTSLRGGKVIRTGKKLQNSIQFQGC